MSFRPSVPWSSLSSASAPAERRRVRPGRERVHHLLAGLAFATLALVAQPADAQAQQGWFCGPLEAGYGPFDYRTTPYDKREVVERFHFTPQVRSLTRGASSTAIGGDIGYTLHSFPNHPVALDAMARLGRKLGTNQPRGARYTVECYFERAVRFAPDDPQVRILYAHYLSEKKRTKDARQQLLMAERTEPTRADLLYNLGLGFADVGDFEKSLDYAHRAYAAGIELPGLRNRLQRAGKWRNAPAK